MAVSHKDEVSPIDLGSRQSHLRCGWYAVHVRVEEDNEIVDDQAKRGRAQPVERDTHEHLQNVSSISA